MRSGEQRQRHGCTDTAEYRIWTNIKTRCLNHRNVRYALYGGRGITICDRWKHSFAAFLADVGRRPSSAHSLDRVDNNRGYEPGNIRWATSVEQNNNRRDNVLIECRGRTQTLAAWSRGRVK